MIFGSVQSRQHHSRSIRQRVRPSDGLVGTKVRTASAPQASSLRVGPRERAIEEGLATLDDADLVAIVLGTGSTAVPVGDLAIRLLDACGGLLGLARLGPLGLAEHPGLGVAKALRLGASFELGRRFAIRRLEPRRKLTKSSDVATYFLPRIGGLVHEEMWVLALDGQNGVRGARRVAQGGLHGCSIAARDILRAGLADAASAIVLVHNHPSGDPTPSDEDVTMTRAVSEACDVVCVPLLDHVIIAGSRHVSMLDLGILP
jgi:DNA repair protein RadC